MSFLSEGAWLCDKHEAMLLGQNMVALNSAVISANSAKVAVGVARGVSSAPGGPTRLFAVPPRDPCFEANKAWL